MLLHILQFFYFCLPCDLHAFSSETSPLPRWFAWYSTGSFVTWWDDMSRRKGVLCGSITPSTSLVPSGMNTTLFPQIGGVYHLPLLLLYIWDYVEGSSYISLYQYIMYIYIYCLFHECCCRNLCLTSHDHRKKIRGVK